MRSGAPPLGKVRLIPLWEGSRGCTGWGCTCSQRQGKSVTLWGSQVPSLLISTCSYRKVSPALRTLSTTYTTFINQNKVICCHQLQSFIIGVKKSEESCWDQPWITLIFKSWTESSHLLFPTQPSWCFAVLSSPPPNLPSWRLYTLSDFMYKTELCCPLSVHRHTYSH